jgi:hypothetical protein
LSCTCLSLHSFTQGNVNNLYEVIRYYATRTNELLGMVANDDEKEDDDAKAAEVNEVDPTHPTSGGDSGSFYQSAADEDIFQSQSVDKVYADEKEAVSQSQAASQVATQAQAAQQRDERQQVREREQRVKRENYVRRTGRRPTCPIMAGSKPCNGDSCHACYPDEKFDHPAVCKDKTHIV